MSVTVSRADGVTVFTVTSDQESRWPPVCQVLKSLCYSPMCCSVSQNLRRIQGTSLSVLGSLQIVIGLLNIGLGAILHLSRSASLYIIWSLQCPYWLGALFIIFGIMCILSERYPSPCTVILNVTLNLAGVAFAITAITLYSASVANIHLWWYYCEEPYYGTTPSPSLQDEYRRNACLTSKKLVLMLLRSIHGVLIVFSVLELCVVISCVVLGIKALKSSNKEKNKSFSDPEQFKPLLEEVSTNSAA
ncbi:membrane-spanning 4-domains subfamily A member 8 isoform X1 [Kryptolebias marmoratus]|uniref:Membrane-spanning 4-domains subfamily A member 8-like n=1 Tax=Kryptolebias marmoratus TaxID=37003 RepID=A0A3Q3G9E3_KRYMA|nr:membrane-spanning 4-domains subfamily A member 8 isoform X1 [Kryptolebias marmoratus]XP_024866803.1 membrane-spanning 4-domains subfamily A member 8 isoform X1 [Kryptolebias marmoratus]